MTAVKKTQGWIKGEDLNELVMKISAENNTTKTKVLSYETAEIAELSEKGFILSLPAKSCAQGHLLSIELQLFEKNFNDEKKKEAKLPVEKPITKFHCTAKISNCEPIGTERLAVTLQFYQFDEEGWKKILQLFSEKQKIIQKTLKLMQE